MRERKERKKERKKRRQQLTKKQAKQPRKGKEKCSQKSSHGHANDPSNGGAGNIVSVECKEDDWGTARSQSLTIRRTAGGSFSSACQIHPF